MRCATTPELQPVVSNAVAAIGYDAAAQEVHVEFIDSGVYVYEQIPLAIWQAFAAASSKGGFVNDVLKPFFPYRKA